jgi:hypothetical protein
MRRLIIGLAALLGAACSSSNSPNSPPPVPTSQLHFVVQDISAAPLYTAADSFYAKVGDGRELRLYYKDTISGGTGEEFLRFEVPGDALLRKPDGSTFQAGDSILISVTVLDAQKFVFDFRPAGLQFSPNHPARLKVEYAHSDHDYDGDGTVTPADSTIQGQLDLWKNDPPSTLWFKQGGVNFESLEELDANIVSFSQYAVAW